MKHNYTFSFESHKEIVPSVQGKGTAGKHMFSGVIILQILYITSRSRRCFCERDHVHTMESL